MIRLVIADDHQAILSGLTTMFAGTDIEVAAQATTCEQTVEYAQTCDPDIVLLDVRMGNGSGLDALRQIKSGRPETQVVVFSAYDSMPTLVQAYQLGAAGFASKMIDRKKLIEMLQRVSKGRRAWTRRQLRQIGTAKRSATDRENVYGLSRREKEVIGRLVQGMCNEEIAESLAIDVETVKQHVKSLLAKLGVEDRTQTVVWALHNGWEPSPLE